LPDHHAPTGPEIERILTRARDAGAHALVITEKDHVKWSETLRYATLPADTPPLVRPTLELAFRDGEATLRHLLADVLQAGPGAR
ncbi:MAG: hypothetical protein ACOC3G_06990, partial [Phycisphaeraceae bacterium]